MKKMLVILLVILMLFAVPVHGQGPIWLPLIMGGSETMPAILKVSDGTTSINLIKGAGQSGFHLTRWRPSISPYKGGGTWQDSPLADGRRLADKKFENAVETFELKLVGADQDEAIRESQELRRLLEKASDYWTTSWQDEPVWLEAAASCETNLRYAVIHAGRIPEDDGPYQQPFLQADGSAVMDNLTLVVERGPWTACRPGTGACVETGGQQVGWEYEPWEVNTALPVNEVWDIIELDSGRLLATDNGGGGQVWRTDDGGATPWVAATTPPALEPYALLEASDGYIYCACFGAGPAYHIYRSGDDGVNWVLRNNANGSTGHQSITEHTDGYLYLAESSSGGDIKRSNDGGATWVSVYSGFDIRRILSASDGYIYAAGKDFHGGGSTTILRSQNGTTWYVVFKFFQTFAFNEPECIRELGDGRLYVAGAGGPGGSSEIFMSIDGTDWAQIYQNVNVDDIADILYTGDGYYYIAIRANGEIRKGADPSLWNLVVDIGANALSLLECSGNDRIYVGGAGDIWWSPLDTTVGRAVTCADEVYIANKQNRAQLTHIKTYDASAAPPNDYLDRFPAGTFPYQLLPAALANGDAVYFGIETAVFDSGPFDNVVLDLIPALGDFNVTWQYSDGFAGWPALNVHDDTFAFSQQGVCSVHWIPPDDWAPEAVDGVTAYWVQALVGGVVGVPTGAQQDNRDVYTVNWPRMDVDDAQVTGDVPALLRFKLHNRSDEDGYATAGLDSLDNRVAAGLRSLDRGPTFTAFLNCADEQNPLGVAAAAGTGTAIGNEVRTPTGRVATHTTQAGGLNYWDAAFTFTLGPTVARDFYGTYHAWLRAQLYEPSAGPAGDHDDVRVRLRVRSGEGGVSRATPYAQFTGRDAWDGVAGREEAYKDWQLLDFGQVELPATGLLRADELPDELAVDVEIASSAGTNLRVDLYDLVLIPTDEWAGDFADCAYEDDSCVENGYLLDVDSLAHPKRVIRSLVRTADAAGFLRAAWQPRGPGPAVLQANADQRLWFLSARGMVMGEEMVGGTATTLTDTYADFLDSGVRPGMIAHNTTTGNSAEITAVAATTCTTRAVAGNWNLGNIYFIVCPNWRSEPWVCHSVQAWANARYLSMRGAE